MSNFRPIIARINSSALKANLNQVKALAPNSKVLAIIKANGYGHGIARVAKALSQADGFGVASIDEAIQLRQQGFLHPIVLLEGIYSEAELPLVLSNRLDLVVHCFEQIDYLKSLSKHEQLTIWVKLDTGMHRLGFTSNQIPAFEKSISEVTCSLNINWMSHFASADIEIEFTDIQLKTFLNQVSTKLGAKSMANSAAIQTLPESHLDWVRPGIMLYGAYTMDSAKLSLKPVMTLSSQVIALRWVQQGQSVGYGNSWTAIQLTLIATVAAGYGDGYPRHAPSGTPVLVCGERMPLVGRVSMDMITVDVTALAESVEIGSIVELWGENLAVDEIAKQSGTIAYELLCGVTQRVPREDVMSREK